MQNLKEYYFMFLLIVYLFKYKHKKSYFNTQTKDRIKVIKLVEHCYTDSNDALLCVIFWLTMYAYSDRAIVALSIILHCSDCANQAENTTHTFLYPFYQGDFMPVVQKLKGRDGLNDISRQSFAFGLGGVYGLNRSCPG